MPTAFRLHAGRLALLAAGGLALFAGLWTGLSRAGLVTGGGLSAHHGPLLVLGFLGTLIALERAVGFRVRWGYLTPAASAGAVVWLLVGGPPVVSGALFAVAGATVAVLFGHHGRAHPQPHLVLLAGGALAWALAAGLWATGASPVRLTPLLAAFLVLTILGERLELSRLRLPAAASIRRGLAAAGVFGVGAVVAWAVPAAGLVVAGVGLVAATGWFVRHDLARVTIRQAGLPRFAAACMLAGYAWLGTGGLLWVALGLEVGGPLVRDAAVHAIFLGFVLSMVMGHAPIILPAVLRVALPYRSVAWVPLVLLHATVALRVAADMAGSTWGRGVASAGNVAAVVLFVAVSVGAAVHARLTASSSRSPAGMPVGAGTRPTTEGGTRL